MAEYTIDKIEYGDNVYKLQDNVSGYVTGSNVVPYLTCGTGASTVAKTTTLVTGTLPSTLTTGVRVAVRFTNSNTASDPTITIGSYGAIAIKRYGTTAPSTSAATSWNAGNVITLVYDGTYWLMADWTSPNTTYSEISAANITNGSGSTTGLVTGRRAKAAVEAFQTDEKVGISLVENDTMYYPIVGTDTATASREYDSDFTYMGTAGTTSTIGIASISLGNYSGSTTEGNKRGMIRLYGSGSGHTRIYTNATNGEDVYFPNKGGTIALTDDIPTVPSNIVNTITTTAGAHTAITNATGAVSFNVPTTAAHVGAATSDHTHGNITNGGDITATAPTIANGDQIIINDHSASKITNGPTFDGSTTTTALTPKGTWETFSKFSGSYNDLSDKPTIPTNTDEKIKLTSQSTSGTYPLIFGPTSITSNSTYQGYYNTGITVNPSTKTITATTFVGALTGTASGNLTSSSTLDATKLSGTIPSGCYTNTTYGISGSLSNHAFTSTLTAGGSGTTSVLTLAAGTGITLTDDTTNKKITIACSVTNTDTKVSTAAITSEVSYYPVLGSDTTEAATKFYDKTGFGYTSRIGTASTEGTAVIALGNNISTGTAGNKSGRLLLYGKNSYTASILTDDLTAHTTIKFPNKSGTIALTSDLSNYVQKPSENGTSGWILKTRGNNNTYWDAPNVYQFGIYEDIDNPGTYSYYGGDIEDYIRSAFENGQNLALQLDLLNSINELDTYMLTDYHAEWVNADGGDYVVLWFTGVFRTGVSQKKITVGVYLDYYQIEHEYGEIAVDISEIDDEKAFFYVNSLTSVTISSTNTPIKLPINGMTSGVGFTYDSTNKGIICNKTSRYAISAQIGLDTATAGDLIGLHIYKDGTGIIGPSYHRVGGNYDPALLLPTIVTLEKDSVYTVYIRNNTASRGKTSTGVRISCWEVE